VLWDANECGKTKVMTVSRQPFTIQIMADQNNREVWNISSIWVMQDVDGKLYRLS
jgi:hypothetical protein